MSMDTFLSVTDAARDLTEIVRRAYQRQEATTLLENGIPVARIVPPPPTFRTGKEIAARLTASKRPKLSAEEVEAFEEDLRAARLGCT